MSKVAEVTVKKVYCDGSSLGNPGKGGWAWWSSDADFASGSAEAVTNNQMELKAAIEALLSAPEGSFIEIILDSMYVKNGIEKWMPTWIAKGWKTSGNKEVKNQELWKELKAAAEVRSVTWTWVKGHSGEVGNETVDSMARKAAETQVGSSPKVELTIDLSIFDGREVKTVLPTSAIASVLALAKKRGIVSSDLELCVTRTLEEEIQVSNWLYPGQFAEPTSLHTDIRPRDNGKAWYVKYSAITKRHLANPNTAFRQVCWVKGKLAELETLLGDKKASNMAKAMKNRKYLATLFSPNEIRPKLAKLKEGQLLMLDASEYPCNDGSIFCSEAFAQWIFGHGVQLKGKAIVRGLTKDGMIKGGLTVLPESAMPKGVHIIAFESKDAFSLPWLQANELIFWVNSVTNEDFKQARTDLQSLVNLSPVTDPKFIATLDHYVKGTQHLFSDRSSSLIEKMELFAISGEEDDGSEATALHVARELHKMGVHSCEVPSIHAAVTQHLFNGMMDPERGRLLPIRWTGSEYVTDAVSIYVTTAPPELKGTKPLIDTRGHEELLEQGIVPIVVPAGVYKTLLRGHKEMTYGQLKGISSYAYRTPNDITSGCKALLVAGTQTWGSFIMNTPKAFELMFTRNNGGDNDDSFVIYMGAMAWFSWQEHDRRASQIRWSNGRGSLVSPEEAQSFFEKITALEAGYSQGVCGWNMSFYAFRKGEVAPDFWLDNLDLSQNAAEVALSKDVSKMSWIESNTLTCELAQTVAGLTGTAANWLMTMRLIHAGVIRPATNDPEAIKWWNYWVKGWLANNVLSLMISDVVDAEIAGTNLDQAMRTYRLILHSSAFLVWVGFNRCGTISFPHVILGDAAKTRLVGRSKQFLVGGIDSRNAATEKIGDQNFNVTKYRGGIAPDLAEAKDWDLYKIFVDQAQWIAEKFNQDIKEGAEKGLLMKLGIFAQEAYNGLLPELRESFSGSFLVALGERLKEISKERQTVAALFQYGTHVTDQKALRAVNAKYSKMRSDFILSLIDDDMEEMSAFMVSAAKFYWTNFDYGMFVADEKSGSFMNAKKAKLGGTTDNILWTSLHPSEVVKTARAENNLAILNREPWFHSLKMVRAIVGEDGTRQVQRDLGLALYIQLTLTNLSDQEKLQKRMEALNDFQESLGSLSGITVAELFKKSDTLRMVNDKEPLNQAMRRRQKANRKSMEENLIENYGDSPLIGVEIKMDKFFPYLVFTVRS